MQLQLQFTISVR